MSKKQVIRQYHTACEDIRKTFTATYFEDYDPTTDDLHFWISDTPGAVCNISDYYYSMEDMVLALELEIPVNVFFAWYDHSLEESHNPPINLRHYHNIHKGIPPCAHGVPVSQFMRCNDCNCLSLCCDREIEPAKQECREGETNYFICTDCKKPC